MYSALGTPRESSEVRLCWSARYPGYSARRSQAPMAKGKGKNTAGSFGHVQMPRVTGFLNVPLKKASKRKTAEKMSKKQLLRKAAAIDKAENWAEKKLVHVTKKKKVKAVKQNIKKAWM